MEEKAYRTKMENMFKTFDPCEIDSSKCDEDQDQPEQATAAAGQGSPFDDQWRLLVDPSFRFRIHRSPGLRHSRFRRRPLTPGA